MKENYIAKINNMGRAGYIISNIAKVLLIVATIVCLVGAIALAAFPKEFIKLTVGGNATIDINLERFGGLPKDAQEKIINNLLNAEIPEDQLTVNSNSKLTINDTEYDMASIETSDKGMTITAASQEKEITLRDMVPAVIVAVLSLIMTIVTVFFIGGLCKAFRDCESPFEENVINKMRNLAISLIPWVVIKGIQDSLMESMFSNKVSINFNIDLALVLTVLIILGLTYVFKYGAMLQQESDETL